MLFAVVLLGLAQQIFFTDVKVTASWAVRIESGTGLPPAEVYFGNERIGMTPITIPYDPEDPRFVEVAPLGSRSAESMLTALGSNISVLSGSATVHNQPNNFNSLAGDVLLAHDPSGMRVNATWWNSIGRWPDQRLDRIIPVIVENGVTAEERGFLLRARRGKESALAVAMGLDRPRRTRADALRRFLFRREHLHGTLIITLGGPLDFSAEIANTRPESESIDALPSWVLDRFPVGTEQLDLPPAHPSKEDER